MVILVACSAFMFIDLRTPPIVLWDESRQAVNALEMRQHGLGLVTTYGFRPDLWNTKPPLQIWLMWAAMSVFGEGEWAVRLPSMLAAIGTLALSVSWVRRVTGSFWTGALAAFLLTTSFGFFGEFGARTGDYDALLCFFTTAYLYVLFFATHRRRPGPWRLVLAGLLVAGAVMTKSVAGLVPGVAVPLYLLLAGRWRRPLQSPWYMAALVCAVLPVGVFLFLREQAAPGYLRAVVFNDAGGRFSSAFEGHVQPPWFYLESTFLLAFFSAGLLALAAPLGLVGARGVARQGLIFSLCVVGAVLGVLSVSATKLNHYALTAYPFIAAAVAIAVRMGLRTLARLVSSGAVSRTGGRSVVALLGLIVCLIAVRAVWLRTVFLPRLEFKPQAEYGELFTSLSRRGAARVQVVDSGVFASGSAYTFPASANVPRDYAPQLRFYALLWKEHGLAVERIPAAALPGVAAGTVVASCDPALRHAVLRLGDDLSGAPECVAVRVADRSKAMDRP
ncbi:MAG: glycosyltransferase family 39 protein [Caulobacteraceae bacterium]